MDCSNEKLLFCEIITDGIQRTLIYHGCSGAPTAPCAPGTGIPDAPGAGTRGSLGTLFFAIFL